MLSAVLVLVLAEGLVSPVSEDCDDPFDSLIVSSSLTSTNNIYDYRSSAVPGREGDDRGDEFEAWRWPQSKTRI